jgi:annexin A7/11
MKGMGTDEAAIISIMTSASTAQIQAIKRHYEAKQHKSLQGSFESELTGNLEKVCVGLLYPSREHFLAVQLRNAMKGVGTDEDPIVRILGGNDKDVSRRIAEAYFSMYNSRLQDDLKKEVGATLHLALTTWIDLEDPEGVLAGTRRTGMPLVNSLEHCVAERDAQLIRDACAGIGTDEKQLIQIICARSKRHLAAVDMKYREHFGTPLPKQIESECSGDFKKIMKYAVLPESVFDMLMINQACDGLGTNESLLIEVFATRDPRRLAAVREKFDQCGKPLIDKLNGELSGKLKDVIMMMFNGRSEAGADEGEAEQQAQQLHDAGPGMSGTDESVWVRILASSSVAQCGAIARAYERKFSNSLEHAIRSEFSGDLKRALLAITLDPIDYYCERLHDSFKGMGTDEVAVARILGGNDKPTVHRIATRYFQKFDTRLVDKLGEELSGDFKDACVAWVSLEGFP